MFTLMITYATAIFKRGATLAQSV